MKYIDKMSKQEFLKIIENVDFIEVHNAYATYKQNDMAKQLANKFNKAKTKGSDSHYDNYVGLVGTNFTVNIKSESDLINAIKQNNIK